MPTHNELFHKRPRISPTVPEFGDARDVQRVFGIKESLCYHLFKTGQIKGVLVTGTGKKSGKRLFDYRSIRSLLAKRARQEAVSEPATGQGQ